MCPLSVTVPNPLYKYEMCLLWGSLSQTLYVNITWVSLEECYTRPLFKYQWVTLDDCCPNPLPKIPNGSPLRIAIPTNTAYYTKADASCMPPNVSAKYCQCKLLVYWKWHVISIDPQKLDWCVLRWQLIYHSRCVRVSLNTAYAAPKIFPKMHLVLPTSSSNHVAINHREFN